MEDMKGYGGGASVEIREVSHMCRPWFQLLTPVFIGYTEPN